MATYKVVIRVARISANDLIVYEKNICIYICINTNLPRIIKLPITKLLVLKSIYLRRHDLRRNVLVVFNNKMNNFNKT